MTYDYKPIENISSPDNYNLNVIAEKHKEKQNTEKQNEIIKKENLNKIIIREFKTVLQIALNEMKQGKMSHEFHFNIEKDQCLKIVQPMIDDVNKNNKDYILRIEYCYYYCGHVYSLYIVPRSIWNLWGRIYVWG